MSTWRDSVLARLAGGARYAGLYAVGRDRLRCALVDGDGKVEIVESETAESFPSLVDATPAAAWDEREAHDLHGVAFNGHDPLRPLVAHGAQWRTPVSGEGVHEVAVGPIHASVIESGHFRFHNVGERVLLLDLRLFYKHRGLERAAEGQTLADGVRFAQRACAACAVANSTAYSLAAEELMGIEQPAATRRARTVLCEVERFYNHLHDLSTVCAGVGFAAGAMAFAALKERAQRLNQSLFGHRFLFDTVAVGGSPVAVDTESAAAAVREIAAIEAEARSAWREMMFNTSVQDRLDGIGILSRHEALSLGAVGPAARASGVDNDVRSGAPVGLEYAGFKAASPQSPAGDVRARVEMRALELSATAAMLEGLLLGGLEAVAAAADGSTNAGLAGARVESPRGETLCCVEAEGGRITRLHLRTASFANWRALAATVPGNLLPDFPLINKSFELCYACVDR